MIALSQYNAKTLCDALDYTDSPAFMQFDHTIPLNRLDKNFAHLFERAIEYCNLKGVYSFQAPTPSTDSIPIVYVCEAETEKHATEIHRRVWNQNIVPFLLVASPDTVRLYNGFRFDKNDQEPFSVNIPWDEIESRLAFLNRQSLDYGEVWQSRELQKEPFKKTSRLDVHLLGNLKKLGKKLAEYGLDQESAHGLIGKYIYLQYMRHRRFLSNERLKKWGIEPNDIFTRKATLVAFNKLDEILHEELNGTVFPMGSKNKIKKKHLEKVAAVFFGDDPETGQQALFELYDFSFIPTELLSTIYENFLHATEQGKTDGAYYTPLPLVNFVLNELEKQKPLTDGMTIFDPSCGSGAFLIQSYRRLIRKKYPNGNYEPETVKSLLMNQIFGIDKNRDACRVAQLGLLLTLLDHIQPPGLFGQKKFRLPDLNGKIIEADVFDPSVQGLKDFENKKFDWIIGNPPWMKLGQTSLAARWCNARPKERPTSNSLAEAFVWRSLDFAKDDGALGLLLPAMTLFNIKKGDSPFRQRFFLICDVWTIANFANLRRMLFPGAKAPGAAFFFKPAPSSLSDSNILTYAPIMVEQTINHAWESSGAWNIIVNSSEIRYVPISEARTGDPLVWKTAMWGSQRDLKFLRRIAKKFPDFETFASQHDIKIHEGPQLRKNDGKEQVEAVPEIKDKNRLVMDKLKNCGRIFVFPKGVFEEVSEELCFIRKGRSKTSLSVCVPPHILIDEARRFAIFSEEFILVPPKQLGASYEKDVVTNRLLLKTLALYLNSHFVKYHQFYNAPQWGIRTDVAVLETLHCLPIPLDSINESEITRWAELYDELQNNAASKTFCPQKQDAILTEANQRINKALGLRSSEVLLIDDFLNYKIKFADGRIPADLLQPCSKAQLVSYAKQLKKELNCFFDDEDRIYHDVTPVSVNGPMEAIRINIFPSQQEVRKSETEIVIPETIHEILRRQHSQWLYFQRNLRIFYGNSVYLFKPEERYHWTESQAILDADNILADIITMKEGEK